MQCPPMFKKEIQPAIFFKILVGIGFFHFERLCELNNETNTTFPMTNLRLIYEMVAPQIAMVLEV